MVLICTDDDVARLSPAAAVTAMRAAVLAAHRRELTAPPRAVLDLGDSQLKVTAGRTGRWLGYRSYCTGVLDAADQLVVLQDGSTGRLTAIGVGDLLGQYRTGALGAVAVDAIARPDATTLGLIGTGRQAYAQVWALRAVRDLTDVAVYGRDPARRAAFADRLAGELAVPVRAVDSAERAARERDVVVLATNSATPVLDPAWLAPGTSVTTLGPKQRGRSEFDTALADRAALLVTDSLAQVAGYDPPFVLTGTPAGERLRSLGAVVAGELAAPTDPAAVRLYCSVGLAGTEPALLAALVGERVDR